MENSDNNDFMINFITVIPKNQFSLTIFINDQDEAISKAVKHSEDYFLQFLSKGHKEHLNELIYSFLPFIINVQDDEIIELSVNEEKEIEHLKRSLNSSINQKVAENKENERNKNSIDIFNKFSDNSLNKKIFNTGSDIKFDAD